MKRWRGRVVVGKLGSSHVENTDRMLADAAYELQVDYQVSFSSSNVYYLNPWCVINAKKTLTTINSSF